MDDALPANGNAENAPLPEPAAGDPYETVPEAVPEGDLDVGADAAAPEPAPEAAAGSGGVVADMVDAVPTPEPVPPEVLQFLRLFGQVVNAASVYHIGHKMVQQALDDAMVAIGRLLETRERLTVAVADGALMADDVLVPTRNSLILNFVKKLDATRIDNLTFTQGMGRDDLARLAEVLGLPSTRIRAAMSELKGSSSLIKVNTASYRRVDDGEVVVKKGDLVQGLAGLGTGIMDGTTTQVMAFVKGDMPGEARTSDREPLDPEHAAAQLADLILKAADIRPSQVQLEDAETLLEAVVGSLRRKGDELLADPAVRTAQGRKSLAKMLVLMERELLDRLRGASLAETVLTAASAAVREIEKDIAVDALAADYMKKQQAMANAEGKILKFLKRAAGQGGAAATALKERLLEEGLDEGDWQQLAMKGGGSAKPATMFGAGGTESGNSADAVSGAEVLLMLLSRLDVLLDGKAKDPEAPEAKGAALRETTDAIRAEMEAVADRVSQKVEHLATAVAELATEPEPQSPKARKKRAARLSVFTILAEIVQELFQPLSVVKGVVDMMLGKYLGEVPDEQLDVLKLAGDGIDRLQLLMERLRDVCGNPATYHPDERILDYAYGRTDAAPTTAAPEPASQAST